MKNIISIIAINTILFANTNQDLLEYQKNFTMCNGKTNYEIADCFLNTKVDYSKGRADTYNHIEINKEELEKAEKENKEYEYIMSILPQTKRYLELEEYLNYLYSIENKYEQANFKKYEKIHSSSENIRKTKRILNLLQNAGLDDTTYFNDDMVEAIKEYQKRHGFEVNGKLWKETRKELNKPLSKLIKKVKKNLELERSLNEKKGNYVYINIPEFKMYYYKEDKPILNMRVVVGKKHNRTPIFQENLKYIVKNPKWNVPDSIYYKEYSNWSYEKIKRKGFAFTKDGKLYQKPGTRNALGIVKFLFPNTYNVYMHDTPSKSLFKKRKRAYSHGCIRLQKPIEFLNILGYEYNKSNKESWITLKEEIPVHVEYHTVWIDNEGKAQFRNDIYNYEKKLFKEE